MRLGKGIIVVVVALVAAVAAPSASFAGKNDGQKLQKRFAAMHGKIAEISERFSEQAPPGLAKDARQAQRSVKDLSKDDLAQLRNLLRMAPNWRKIPALLESAMEAQEAQLVTAQAPVPSCPPGLPDGILDWFIARGVAQAVDFLQLFAPDDLVVVTPAGGGTVSAHPIKLGFQVAYQAAQTAALVLETIYFVADECENAAHQELLREVYDKIDKLDDDIRQQFLTVKTAQRQIMRLLLTPQGRREIDPDVLTCTGDDCPQVIACPGDECSFPIEPGP